MEIRLRGHHLLCLLGYRGKGYSAEFCANMTGIYEMLRTKPDSKIEMIEGPDDICREFPKDQHSHCENASVYEKDASILEKVGVRIGDVVSWAEVLKRVETNLVPEDIGRFCWDCRWQSLGLCQEGIRIVREGEPLPAVQK